MPSTPAAKGVATSGSSSLEAVNRLTHMPSSRWRRMSSLARASAQATLRPSHSISAISRRGRRGRTTRHSRNRSRRGRPRGRARTCRGWTRTRNATPATAGPPRCAGDPSAGQGAAAPASRRRSRCRTNDIAPGRADPCPRRRPCCAPGRSSRRRNHRRRIADRRPGRRPRRSGTARRRSGPCGSLGLPPASRRSARPRPRRASRRGRRQRATRPIGPRRASRAARSSNPSRRRPDRRGPIPGPRSTGGGAARGARRRAGRPPGTSSAVSAITEADAA